MLKLALCAVLLTVAGPAMAQTPDWVTTQNFTAPEGSAPGAAFAGKLSLATTQMTVTTDPADKMVQFPFAWWGIFDFLAKQDPPGAAPLMTLDSTLFIARYSIK